MYDFFICGNVLKKLSNKLHRLSQMCGTMYIFVQNKVLCMQTKILLDEEQIPKKWYNVQADLPSPLDPPLHPTDPETDWASRIFPLSSRWS